MSIRPVTHCLPSSQALWDDTNLPMCVVLTPCHEDGDDKDNSTTTTTTTTTTALEYHYAKPLSAIPKCLHCGAPHPTTTTHFRPQYSSQILLCYLCGRTCSTLFTDQANARIDEFLDVDMYDNLSIHDLKPPIKQPRENNSSMVETLDFRVPLKAIPSSNNKNNNNNKSSSTTPTTTTTNTTTTKPLLTWQLPAMACPPVWWIVIDGTIQPSTHGIQATSNYWNTIGTTLMTVMEHIPSHVHVGIVTAMSTRLACWDLFRTKSTTTKGRTSTMIPSVRHIPYSTSSSWDLCLVPANEDYKKTIKATISAMVDAGRSGFLFRDNHNIIEQEEEENVSDDDRHNNKMGFPLGMTLEILLQTMDQATHPGGDNDNKSIHHDDDDNNNDDETMELWYAGGKILVLMGNPPLEIVPSSKDGMSHISQPPFYQGGVAGACFVDDDRQKWGGHTNANPKRNQDTQKIKSKKKDTLKRIGNVDLTDMTAVNLKDYVKPFEPENMLESIGKRCAKAALGVDLIVLVPEATSVDNTTTNPPPIPWYGLSMLRVLSDTSGAPGPLMFGTARQNDGLVENVLSRTPWQSGMVFGCQLRFRTSPGLEVEDSPVEKEKRVPLQLAPFLSSGGLMGPAYAAKESSRKDSGLWIMGTSDPFTSYTVDLQPAKHVQDQFYVDGMGEVTIRPVMQTCFVYTCIETDGSEDDPNFYTVRKMKISNILLSWVDDVESIFDTLDPEALAVILFHKISLDAYLTGLVTAQQTAESWFRSLLTCVYQSAQIEQAKIEDEMEKSQQVQPTSQSATTMTFVASERLLDQPGDLEVQDVLLGYGHPKIATLPLLIFALLQCDALRPSSGNFLPSMDSRLCAMAQMASMPPGVLSKAIAPSLLLWSRKDDEILVESLPLSKVAIVDTIKDIGADNNNNSDGILLMDSPQRVILCRADRFVSSTTKRKGKGNISAWHVGPNLESSILSCLKGFRTLPAHWKEIELFLDRKEFPNVADHILDSFLVEDKPTASGFTNFTDWKMEMALLVQEDLEGTGDI